MKVLIIGSGRMGVRHAQGVKSISAVEKVIVADINETALENAKKQIDDPRFQYCLLDDIDDSGFDICIIAATASGRTELLERAKRLNTKKIMIEKPLGQSFQQVKELEKYIADNNLDCCVNLNMRLYDSFIRLRKDLQTLPQLQGEKTITINTGTLGIGANGIHYLDLLYFILDADNAQLVAGEIDDQLIPSGRGPQFGDFGGWATIKFFKNKQYIARAMVAMSASSTVFGSWEIVAPHGRIYFNEVEEKRVDTLRKADSEMPINRYFADYLPAQEIKITSPFLGDLTARWITGVVEGKSLLPSISESVKVHELLFEWLGKSKTHNEVYPIT